MRRTIGSSIPANTNLMAAATFIEAQNLKIHSEQTTSTTNLAPAQLDAAWIREHFDTKMEALAPPLGPSGQNVSYFLDSPRNFKIKILHSWKNGFWTSSTWGAGISKP